MRNSTPPLINRRDLLLLGAASACPTLAFWPTPAQALLPAPPPSPYYLWFIADGIYRISGFYTVTLPPDAGTCQSYSVTGVNYYYGSNFTFTGRSGTSVWNMLSGAPQYQWWEVLDKRNGRYIRLWKYDRLEAKFSDGSRVKVVFNGPNSTYRFQPLVGSERLPNGTRLYPRQCRSGTKKCGGSGAVTAITPSIMTFSWSWSTQEMPW